MSMLVGTPGKMYSVHEYFELSESIKPQFTKYGTNPALYNDKDIDIDVFGNVLITYFIFDNKLYTVQKSKQNEVGFGVSEKIPKTEDELRTTNFTDKRIASISAMSVFSKVFYVLIEIIKQDNSSEYFFKSANETLNSFYEVLFKNKFFKETIKNLGYETRIEDAKFILSKISI